MRDYLMRSTVILHMSAQVKAQTETPGKYAVIGPSMGFLSFIYLIATNVSMILCARNAMQIVRSRVVIATILVIILAARASWPAAPQYFL